MTWNQSSDDFPWWQQFSLEVLRNGPIPRHIAFIMDGNRRYAKQNNIATIKGHEQGFHTLTNCNNLGKGLGIKEITMYALSIENLKRPTDELDGLWELMETKLQMLRLEVPILIQNQTSVLVIGNLSLIPTHLQKLVADISNDMKQVVNPVFTCYLAIAYTSRDEITQSIRTIVSNVESGMIEVNDIDEDLVQKCLYTNVCKYPVDLLIRTSGETRLSDFMLWQSSDAVLHFTDVLWPDFGFWEMAKAVFFFQYSRIRNPACLKSNNVLQSLVDSAKKNRVEKFLKTRRLRQEDIMNSYMKLKINE